MARTRKSTNPWEPELLRLGRRLVRDAAATGTAIALGGFGSIESAISQAVAPSTDRPRLRLVTPDGTIGSDCLPNE